MNQPLKHIWSILCTNSIVDQSSNNVTLSNVIEEITFTITGPVREGPLGVQFQCDLVTLWSKTEEDSPLHGEGVVEFINPDGEKMGENKYDINIKKEHKRLRSILRINGLKINKPGNYIFRISYKTDREKNFIQVAEVPVYIKLLKKVDIKAMA